MICFKHDIKCCEKQFDYDLADFVYCMSIYMMKHYWWINFHVFCDNLDPKNIHIVVYKLSQSHLTLFTCLTINPIIIEIWMLKCIELYQIRVTFFRRTPLCKWSCQLPLVSIKKTITGTRNLLSLRYENILSPLAIIIWSC